MELSKEVLDEINKRISREDWTLEYKIERLLREHLKLCLTCGKKLTGKEYLHCDSCWNTKTCRVCKQKVHEVDRLGVCGSCRWKKPILAGRGLRIKCLYCLSEEIIDIREEDLGDTHIYRTLDGLCGGAWYVQFKKTINCPKCNKEITIIESIHFAGQGHLALGISFYDGEPTIKSEEAIIKECFPLLRKGSDYKFLEPTLAKYPCSCGFTNDVSVAPIKIGNQIAL